MNNLRREMKECTFGDVLTVFKDKWILSPLKSVLLADTRVVVGKSFTIKILRRGLAVTAAMVRLKEAIVPVNLVRCVGK